MTLARPASIKRGEGRLRACDGLLFLVGRGYAIWKEIDEKVGLILRQKNKTKQAKVGQKTIYSSIDSFDLSNKLSVDSPPVCQHTLRKLVMSN